MVLCLSNTIPIASVRVVRFKWKLTQTNAIISIHFYPFKKKRKKKRMIAFIFHVNFNLNCSNFRRFQAYARRKAVEIQVQSNMKKRHIDGPKIYDSNRKTFRIKSATINPNGVSFKRNIMSKVSIGRKRNEMKTIETHLTTPREHACSRRAMNGTRHKA